MSSISMCKTGAKVVVLSITKLWNKCTNNDVLFYGSTGGRIYTFIPAQLFTPTFDRFTSGYLSFYTLSTGPIKITTLNI